MTRSLLSGIALFPDSCHVFVAPQSDGKAERCSWIDAASGDMRVQGRLSYKQRQSTLSTNYGNIVPKDGN